MRRQHSRDTNSPSTREALDADKNIISKFKNRNKEHPYWCGGARAWPKGRDSGSRGEGLRGFKSHPPHQKPFLKNRSYGAGFFHLIPILCSFESQAAWVNRVGFLLWKILRCLDTFLLYPFFFAWCCYSMRKMLFDLNQ